MNPEVRRQGSEVSDQIRRTESGEVKIRIKIKKRGRDQERRRGLGVTSAEATDAVGGESVAIDVHFGHMAFAPVFTNSAE